MAYLDGFNFWASSFYFWAYFIGANSSWVVIPTVIATRSWKKICAAIHQSERWRLSKACHSQGLVATRMHCTMENIVCLPHWNCCFITINLLARHCLKQLCNTWWCFSLSRRLLLVCIKWKGCATMKALPMQYNLCFSLSTQLNNLSFASANRILKPILVWWMIILEKVMITLIILYIMFLFLPWTLCLFFFLLFGSLI